MNLVNRNKTKTKLGAGEETTARKTSKKRTSTDVVTAWKETYSVLVATLVYF